MTTAPQPQAPPPRVGMLATVRNRRGLVAAVEPSDGGPEGTFHVVSIEYIDADGPSVTGLAAPALGSACGRPAAQHDAIALSATGCPRGARHRQRSRVLDRDQLFLALIVLPLQRGAGEGSVTPDARRIAGMEPY